MDGLTNQQLVQYIATSCKTISPQQDVFLDTFRTILADTPKLHITNREALLFEGLLLLPPEAIKVNLTRLLPIAYYTILQMRRECKIGRRIGLAAMKCVPDSSRLKPRFKQSLNDLAERLLSVIKLQNKSGLVWVTFPDVERFLSTPQDIITSQQPLDLEVENDLMNKKITSTEYLLKDCELRVDQSVVLKKTLRILFTLETLKSDAAPASLTVSVIPKSILLPDGSTSFFRPLTLSVPSIADVDEEYSQAFQENILASLQFDWIAHKNCFGISILDHFR